MAEARRNDMGLKTRIKKNKEEEKEREKEGGKGERKRNQYTLYRRGKLSTGKKAVYRSCAGKCADRSAFHLL